VGWLFYTDRRVQTYADEKAEIMRLCTFETDTRRTTLVKASKVDSTWYAAAKVESLDAAPLEDRTYVTDKDGSFTFGAVFLTRYDDGCWGYKDMEESAGPCESRAPPSILNLLSELKDADSYAHDWAAIPDYAEGDKIKLAAPVTLSDGSMCQIVTATHYRRGRQKRRCYRIKETGGLVRLSKASLAGSELLSLTAQIRSTSNSTITGRNHRPMQVKQRITLAIRDGADIFSDQMHRQQRHHPIPAKCAGQGHIRHHQRGRFLSRKLSQNDRQYLCGLANRRSNKRA
jgi:Domain of unknown function (DUF6927)